MCCTLRYLFHSLDAKQTLATGWISLNSSHQQRIQCYLFCFHLSLPIDFTFGRKLSVRNLYYWNVTSHSMIGSIVFSFTHEISTFLEIFFFFSSIQINHLLWKDARKFPKSDPVIMTFEYGSILTFFARKYWINQTVNRAHVHRINRNFCTDLQ